MPLIKKKKMIEYTQRNRDELEYIHNVFNEELLKTQSELKNVEYQLEFFGTTSELKQEKTEIQIMLAWLQDQITEIKSSLLSIKSPII